MILVDDQAGSCDLYPFIRNLCPDTILTRIQPPFGDIVWAGNGPDGTDLKVAVEYKQLDDVLTCMIDGRFAGHQAIGLIEHYDRRYLLVEMGRFSFDRNSGVLMKRKQDRWVEVTRNGKGFTYRDLEHWYTTMEEHAQFRIVRTRDEYESARWVVAKHSWYTVKEWDEHNAMKQFHVPPPPVATFQKPGIVRRIAKEIGGIGWDRSIPVAATFKSVREMMNANVQTWAGIAVGADKNGHKLTIGKNRAASIVKEITNGDV